MTEHRPDPLVPGEVDLRDLDGFMLNVERLLASELVALSTGDEFKAAVMLWSRAWKQMPAGSLPNDERILASFSGAGPRWKKVRDMALRGFIECSDGRLYHKVLCDDVMRAWAKKQERIEEQNAEADRKRREREDRARMFAALKGVGVTPAWNIPTRDLRTLYSERVTPPVTEKPLPVTPPVTRTVTANTGQDRTGQEKKKPETAEPFDPRSRLVALCEALGKSPATDARTISKWPEELNKLLAEGFSFEAHILPAARDAKARNAQISSLNYLRGKALELKTASDLSEAGKKEERTRWLFRWLECYAFDGRWCPNNLDTSGIGPAPHEPGTLVTAADLARVAGAEAMRNKLVAAKAVA